MENRKQAIILMTLSSASFCMMSLVVKLSSTAIGTMQQVFFRNLVSLFLVGLLIHRKKLPFLGEKKYQPALCARSFFGFLGVIMLFYATSHARQADVAIQDEAVSAKIRILEARTNQIFQVVSENPDKLPAIRKFMQYYLPTLLKLLRS